MDPQITWDDLLSCLAAGQLAKAKDHAENLSQWLTRGGFPPRTLPRIAEGDDLHRVIARAVVQHVLALDE